MLQRLSHGAALAAAGCLLSLAAPAQTQTLSTELVAGGLDRPVFVTHAPGDPDRLFVLEQEGRIRIIRNGELLAAPFLDIDDRVTGGDTGETGLLGLAFAPDYQESGRFFVNYTGSDGPQLRTFIAEYAADPATDPETADPSSERVLLTFDQPFANHNGGWLGFGPDGYLYISTGDGGAGNDPQNNAQNLLSLLGKILRIDALAGSAGGPPYLIPESNPFASVDNARGEIWAYGLRNPWRTSFDRRTGDLWIADVGQGAREEVNFQPASSPGGENYGWRCREGSIPTPGITECGSEGPFIDPVHDYNSDSPHCAVTGGYVYRGCSLGAEFRGTYFFGDFCSGQIWTLDPENGFAVTLRLDLASGPTSFGEDAAGELYFTTIGGAVLRLARTDVEIECPCPADRDGSNDADVDDLLAYLSAFSLDDADMDDDGDTDIRDLLMYLTAFHEGCR